MDHAGKGCRESDLARSGHNHIELGDPFGDRDSPV
jgi:hypothetical protein